MEGLSVTDADLTVYIHPSQANKCRQAIHRQLSSLLFTYSEIFDGVILAFEVLQIKSRSSKLLPGLIPHFGVELKANLLLFSPVRNMLIEGKVVKVGKESIHVLVLGFSSASIMSGDIREELKFNIKNGEGVFTSTTHKRHVIKVGSMVRFLVKSFDEEMLHISGSLVPPHTGSVPWLSKHGVEDGSHIDRHQKRHREGISERDMPENSSLSTKGIHLSSHNHPHKSRKRTAEE